MADTLTRWFAPFALAAALAAGCAHGTGTDGDLDASAVTDARLDGSQASDSGSCGNTQTNPQNCGSCGNVCPTGATCSAGKCACPKGEVCAAACIDTQTDAKNCGTCGNACTGGGSTWSCVAGKAVAILSRHCRIWRNEARVSSV